MTKFRSLAFAAAVATIFVSALAVNVASAATPGPAPATPPPPGKAVVAAPAVQTPAPAVPAPAAAKPGAAPAVAAPPPAPATPAAAANPKTTKVNVNDPDVTIAQLDDLNQVGEPRAKQIQSGRANVPFKSKDDLAKRSGLGPVVDAFWSQVILADVNNACYEDLIKFDGIGKSTVRRIVENRGQEGYKSIDDLLAKTNVNGAPAKTLQALAPNLSFGKITPSKEWQCISE